MKHAGPTAIDIALPIGFNFPLRSLNFLYTSEITNSLSFNQAALSFIPNLIGGNGITFTT